MKNIIISENGAFDEEPFAWAIKIQFQMLLIVGFTRVGGKEGIDT